MSYRIFGDWGTSRLRLYRIENGRIADRLAGCGIGQLQSPPDAVLRALLAPWRSGGDPDAILLSGMVGSRNGWQEVDCVACPAGSGEWASASARLVLDEIPVLIAPGLCHDDPPSIDVMRGEETQIFGALAVRPDLAVGRCSIVLPGTHSKWAMVEDGRITRFTTFLTGEMFALLRAHSSLLRAGTDSDVGSTEDEGGFDEGLDRIASNPALLSVLFEVRTSQLLRDRSPGWASSFLSGLLIGSELDAFAITIAPDEPIYLIGEPALSERYKIALERVNRATIQLDAELCVTRGLSLLEGLN